MHSFHRRVAYAVLIMALSFRFAACDTTTGAALLLGSGPASGGLNFGDIPFPPNSVTTPLVLRSNRAANGTLVAAGQSIPPLSQP